MTVFIVTLKTLSPVHIGDGDELKQDFDFVARAGRTYRINEDALLMEKEKLLQPDHAGHYPPPGALITDGDLDNNKLFRYSLRGTPRSAKTDARVKSFIKDVHDRPYIPGSSLKGALRTALAWTGWNESKVSVDDIRGSSKYWVGQSLERKMFGNNPNLDLLRALHVSDLHGPQEPGGGLLLVNAQVLTKKTAESPIELEAVADNVTFFGMITIDETLFSAMAEPTLHFSNRKLWLDELMKRAQVHSLKRIEELSEWFEGASENYAPVASFYRRLLEVSVGENQALVQLGWGTGWDGKTFWTHLQEDEERFERIVREYRLHKSTKDSPARMPGDPFPRSKRAAMIVKDRVARAVAPFGWVKISMDPVGEPRLRQVWDNVHKMVVNDGEPLEGFSLLSNLEMTEGSKASSDTSAGVIPSDIIWMFGPDRLPQPGDRFDSVVSTDGESFIIPLMGLDSDTEAFGELTRLDNPDLDNVEDGQLIRAEVLTAEKNTYGVLCVRCKLLQILRNKE